VLGDAQSEKWIWLNSIPISEDPSPSRTVTLCVVTRIPIRFLVTCRIRLCRVKMNKMTFVTPLPLKNIPAKTSKPKGGFHPARTPMRQTETGKTTSAYKTGYHINRRATCFRCLLTGAFEPVATGSLLLPLPDEAILSFVSLAQSKHPAAPIELRRDCLVTVVPLRFIRFALDGPRWIRFLFQKLKVNFPCSPTVMK